jgi:hypothetical protein
VSVREVVAIGDPVLREPARELDSEEIASPEIRRLRHQRDEFLRRVARLTEELRS